MGLQGGLKTQIPLYWQVQERCKFQKHQWADMTHHLMCTKSEI